jgi:hypothetical protein
MKYNKPQAACVASLRQWLFGRVKRAVAEASTGDPDLQLPLYWAEEHEQSATQ